MTVATIANLIVSQILLNAGNRLESVALEAYGMHLRTDVYTSVGVLVGMAAIWKTGINMIDPIIAIAVGLFIIHAAYEIFIKSFSPLMDSSLSPEEEEEITLAIQSAGIQGLVNFHDLRTRRSGSDRYVDMHLVVRKGMTIREVHDICDLVEDRIKDSLPSINVLVHAEPCEETDCPVCQGCEEYAKGTDGSV